MKIVCDSCGAKYSIADEKVAGKVFKIRCKKCSSVMVVRGDQEPAPQPAEGTAAAVEYGGDVVWHIVVQGDQQGPFAPAQIGELLANGTVGWDAYVWREGFDGWVPAQDVAELVAAITGQAPGAEQGPPSDAPTAYAQAQGMGADPFGDATEARMGPASGGGEEVASRSLPGGAGADLFAPAGASASPFAEGSGDTEDDVVASGPTASPTSPTAASRGGQMTGARNENSVLFSLANLQALATGGPASGAPPPPSAAVPGQASGEGSGLIDIRALATATATASGSVPASKGGVDDLLGLGAGSPLAGSLGAPALAPVREERNYKPFILGGVAAAGLLAAAVVALAVILRQSPEPSAATPAGTPPATEAAAAVLPPAAGTAPTPVANAAPAAGASATAAAGAQEQAASGAAGGATPARTERERSGSTRERSGASGGASSSSARTAEAAPAPEPAGAAGATKARSGSGGSLDDLMADVLGPSASTGRPTGTKAPRTGGGSSAPAASNLPDTPGRDAALAALRSVEAAVRGCGQGQHGVAQAAVTVSGSNGRVTNVQVTGQFAGTPIGSCVARAVRSAQFPRFSRPSFSVNFPYRL